MAKSQLKNGGKNVKSAPKTARTNVAEKRNSRRKPETEGVESSASESSDDSPSDEPAPMDATPEPANVSAVDPNILAIPFTMGTYPLVKIGSDPRQNLTRSGSLAYLSGGQSHELVDLLVRESYDPGKGMLTGEPFLEELHGESIRGGFQIIDSWLQGQLDAMIKKGDRDAQASWQTALHSFRATHQDPKSGKWIMPEIYVDDGNTRWICVILANAIRKNRGLSEITELPVKLFTRNLNAAEHASLQARSNQKLDGVVTMTLPGYLYSGKAYMNATKQISRKDFASFLSSRGEDGTRHKNNLNRIHPILVLDYFYPSLNIVARLQPDYKGTDKLTETMIAGAYKQKEKTALIDRILPVNREKLNQDMRQAAEDLAAKLSIGQAEKVSPKYPEPVVAPTIDEVRTYVALKEENIKSFKEVAESKATAAKSKTLQTVLAQIAESKVEGLTRLDDTADTLLSVAEQYGIGESVKLITDALNAKNAPAAAKGKGK